MACIDTIQLGYINEVFFFGKQSLTVKVSRGLSYAKRSRHFNARVRYK